MDQDGTDDYEPPELHEYGAVEHLTRGTGGGDFDAFATGSP
ncbi:lasso RiPP family leader peptide-containing protein [Halococcoides cellulosivorans]|uniref:Lasso RiPP family leader peptide-containing protein n=1 Tax=Halococcoides cellulosivorans TaxID=1679096 RepID=A0A2R4X309_9EURY|nr:lasso RiPP family leader peptide-containing protein [Halococcoides cellulosivorans]AWB28178.1 hypothetical protein HARCEL1_10905 [Halococcoides cellulosivorans]